MNKFGKYFYCVEISTLWRLMNLNVSPEIGDQENNEKDAALYFHLITHGSNCRMSQSKSFNIFYQMPSVYFPKCWKSSHKQKDL